MSKTALRKTACALSVAIAALSYSEIAAAKTCWPFGTITGGEGRAYSKDTAKQYARVKWRIKVRGTATAGTAYTNWDLAENRVYLNGCTRKNSWSRWKCTARATPCRP